jgi:glycosyl transferase family 2
MKLAGLVVFRNAGDLIGLVTLHHLREVVDHVYALDNGSSDSGPALLKWLARATGRLTIRHDDTIRPKREYLDAMARQAHSDGFDAIVPFDSDELWNATRERLHEAFTTRCNVIRCPVVNFIQRRKVLRATALSWRHAVRRCDVVDGSMPDVTSGQISFMECPFPSKVAFRSHPTPYVHSGQHSVDIPDLVENANHSIEIFHLPMRAKSELFKRVSDYEPRRATLRTTPNDAWQGRHWAERVRNGQVDHEWQALSYSETGTLDVGNRRVTTFHDSRLVALLRRAAMTWHWRLAGPRLLMLTERSRLA